MDVEEVKGDFSLFSYKCGDFLGKGGFGTVHRYNKDRKTYSKYHSRPNSVAVKLITLTRSDQVTARMLEREFKIMTSLRHQNIVRFLGRRDITRSKSPMIDINLVMEFCPIDLRKLLDIKKSFSPSDAGIIIKQVLKGLQYLHNNNIIHRDIKPGNVLIVPDLDDADWTRINVQYCIFKLADFGLAKKLEEVSSSLTISMTPCGSPGYWAPEVQEALEDGMKAGSHFSMDSYSMGILTFKLVTGRLPTPQEKECLADEDSLTSKDLTAKLGCNQRLENFLRATLPNYWRDRLNTNQLLQHNFVKKAPDLNLSLREAQANCDLHRACKKGDRKGIKAALKRGADINSRIDDKSPLEITCCSGDYDVVCLLMYEDANVYSTNRNNQTPMWFAASAGHDQVVSRLFRHDPDDRGHMNIQSNTDLKTTPLMEAVLHGHTLVVEVLITYGADVNIKNSEGKTVLKMAKKLGKRHKIVEMLLDWENICKYH